MHAIDRARARRNLDRKVNALRNLAKMSPPSRGWVRAIREALGMTTYQLGERMRVSQPRIVVLEKSEANRSLTLDSLERAANALNCRLVYALIPSKPLETLVAERAERVAKKQLETTRHSMALENQNIDPRDEKHLSKSLIQQLTDEGGSELWREET